VAEHHNTALVMARGRDRLHVEKLACVGWGLGFRALGFTVYGLGFRIRGLRCLRFRVQGLGLEIRFTLDKGQGSGIRVWGLGCKG